MELDTFTRQYVETALWSSTDDDGQPLDSSYGIDDIHPDTLRVIVETCDDFQAGFGELFPTDAERSQAGHDFWLTRNGHGAGFWDRDWREPMPEDIDDTEAKRYGNVGEYLTAMSKPYGSFDLYIGDDGMIHGQ